jgi:uncharacterized protein involved in exopolysaccharide biosynthesis
MWIEQPGEVNPLGHPSIGEELRVVARALISRSALIAGTVFASLLLCVGYLWIAEPQYASTAQILIDPRSKQLLEREVAPTGLGSSSLGPDTLLLDSQIEVIRSQSVMDEVIGLHKLADDPEFGKAASDGASALLAKIAGWVVRGPHQASLPQETPHDQALRKLLAALRVERVNNTYVVAITVRSTDRFKAAAIANSISSTYVNESNNASKVLAEEAAVSLSQPLEKLQREANQSDRKIEQFRAHNGLSGTPEMLVVEQQLKEVSTLLTAAKTATQEEKARWREGEAVSRSGARHLNNVSALQSPLLTQLLIQLNTELAGEAEQDASLLPLHPQAKAMVQKREALERAATAEVREIVARLKSNYELARRNEHEIETRFNALETKLAQSRMAGIKLNEMTAEAATQEELVRSFMNRAKQAAQQVGLPASTTRIIARATPASRVSSPPALTLLLASGALGLMLGVVWAWIMHLLHGSPVERGRAGPEDAMPQALRPRRPMRA